jgi:hypothetical protein
VWQPIGAFVQHLYIHHRITEAPAGSKSRCWCFPIKKGEFGIIPDSPANIKCAFKQVLLHYLKFDPAVAFAAVFGCVLGNRVGLTKTLCCQARGVDALIHQGYFDRGDESL